MMGWIDWLFVAVSVVIIVAFACLITYSIVVATGVSQYID